MLSRRGCPGVGAIMAVNVYIACFHPRADEPGALARRRPRRADAVAGVDDPGTLADTAGWSPELSTERKVELLEELEFERAPVQYFYTRQRQLLGLGHAVLMAKELVGHEPFAVILSDDVVVGERDAGLGAKDLQDEQPLGHVQDAWDSDRAGQV